MRTGKLRVGLFFGGRSAEHEVSVVTALQASRHLDRDKYELVPVYIDKGGEFHTGGRLLSLESYGDLDKLLSSSRRVVALGAKGKPGLLEISGWRRRFTPIDVAFPLTHGSFGEDGCLQGLFELCRLPYVGFGVLGSAIGMDKHAAKLFFDAIGIPQCRFLAVRRSEWDSDPQASLEKISADFSPPVVVKPASVGSSIGVSFVTSFDRLPFAMDTAYAYADKLLVEEAFTQAIEVNCAALGFLRAEASACEQPLAAGRLLTYEDKYLGSGTQASSEGMAGASRIIPAPISPELTTELQTSTVRIFEALDGCGVARVDYFVDAEAGRFWVNEINTIPGSLAYYLWEKQGLEYPVLLDRLISLALERHEAQSKTQYAFASNALAEIVRRGIKG